MNSYTVFEVAKLLGKNPETIRRWIRSGKLKAAQSSRKDGNVVLESDLYRFLRSSSKYSSLAASMVAANSMLAFTAIMTGLVGGIAASRAAGKKELDILPDDIRLTLNERISESEAIIEKKRAAIADLQSEIEAQRKQIEDCKIALDQLPE